MTRFKVADFFCGGGGFSEGFRQMGFDVVYALDLWEPAIRTHELNHPECKADKRNILELDNIEKIDSVVPDTEIIIGSPPCVAFSGSNKAGKADKSLGIRLIEAYLRIVAWKQKKGALKYWLLENVPNSGKFIKDKYSFEELGLPGKGILKIPRRGIYNAADFGAPQTRKRFVCGDYPRPKKSHRTSDWVTISDVCDALGDPLKPPSKVLIKDPNYPNLELWSSDLSDHYYDTRVEEWEWKSAERAKRDHGYMGKMSFPEDKKRPSRTVMATQSASTREAMLLDSSKGGYRMPTIREIASFMSFPITYQFEGNNEGTKFRLVGNAVCCKMSAALAKAIAEKEDLKPSPVETINFSNRPRPSLDLRGRRRKHKSRNPRRPNAKYARHVPYLKIRSFSVRWTCYVHRGSGKGAKKVNVPTKLMEMLLHQFGGIKLFEKALDEFFDRRIPDGNTLQKIYCMTYENGMMGPDEALEGIKEIIDKYYPENLSEEEVLHPITNFGLGDVIIPIRIAAAAYACSKFISLIESPTQKRR